MSDISDLIAEAEDILAHPDTPFRPVVLLRMVIQLAKEVERIDHAQRDTAARPAAKKGQQRSRARTEPEGHTGHAG